MNLKFKILQIAHKFTYYGPAMSTSQTPRLHIEWIDRDATDIVRVLQRKGHTAYLVGGCVRDLLLGKQPKDYDIATTAKPNEVKRAVRNSYVIGKRFRLVLAKRGEDLFEIATFRKDPEKSTDDDPDVEGDNLFGTPEDDATRRDFTINALFYDPINEELIDFAGGMDDLQAGIIRMIGEPVVRFREDPIRIMRAIRLAHMIRFQMDSELKKGIAEVADTLKDSALPRRREEFLKFLRLDDPSLAFLTCNDLDVLKYILPSLSEPTQGFYNEMREFHHGTTKLESPLELFSFLVLNFLKHQLDMSLDDDSLSKYKIMEDEKVVPLMRDELGMFKSEQMTLERAIKLLPTLRKRKEIERKGEKRRWALFRMEAFPLALKLAEKEFLLTAQDLNYWKSEYENRPAELIEASKNNRRRRKRPPRKRNHKPKPKN